MRLTIVGNPENRRVHLFSGAVRAAGLPAPAVVAWRDVAAGARIAADPDTVLRIDSPGEDAEVDRLLRGAARTAEHGEIVGLADWYSGLVAALHRIAATGAPLLNPVHDVATLFDKRRCHGVLAEAGVPVPPALPAVGGYDGLRGRLREAGWSRAFVKPAHGSSASGVLALAIAPGRVRGYTSVELAAGRMYNSLRVRRYDREAEIASIVDSLAPDGLHVERWFPKAEYGGRTVDLRVVVVAGCPSHVVVRASRTPMTNLHLGNDQGDVHGVRAAAGRSRWAAAMETCVRAAACFRGSLHVGVDLMFAPDWRRHAVAEVNAFGDLLPGLTVGGRDTYAEEVRALVSGRYAQWRDGPVPCPA